MNQIIINDMEYIKSRVNVSRIAGSVVLISGATGLIGKYLVRFLADYCGCKVVAVVRDRKKAEKIFEDLGNKVEYIDSDITQLEKADWSVEYMIHGASMTSSKSFSQSPVDVIYTSVEGTRRMLEFARENPVRSFVFLSTMEVYGAPLKEDKIDESHGTNLDTMSARSSYPESKRLGESLCTGYFSQYQVPVRVLRLTQSFGPGVAYEDPRVFAEFARCVMEERNIVLHTLGDTKRNYLYLADACTAILTVMTEGKVGEAYNGANEDTYCSIRQMAELVAKECAEGRIRVEVEPNKELREKMGYGPVLRMNLNTEKLRKLGWKPEVGLSEMYRRMISCM